MIQQYLAFLRDFNDVQKDSVDVNADDAINITDATVIQRYLADIPTQSRIN